MKGQDASNVEKDRFEPEQLRHLSIGLEFAAAVIVLALAGYFADRHWQVQPWGILAGSLTGIAVGMYLVIKRALNLQAEEDRRDEAD